MRDIAQAAGVSAQTVYDSVGSKQALVSSLNDLIDTEAGIAGLARAAAESDDPRELAATNARITRSILEHCGDIVHALVTGAAAEPELAAVLAEGQRRHVEGAGRIVGLLRELDALGSIDPDEAVETLAAVTDIRFAVVLQESYGWSLDRLESWMAATSRTLLLGVDPGPLRRRVKKPLARRRPKWIRPPHPPPGSLRSGCHSWRPAPFPPAGRGRSTASWRARPDGVHLGMLFFIPLIAVVIYLLLRGVTARRAGRADARPSSCSRRFETLVGLGRASSQR